MMTRLGPGIGLQPGDQGPGLGRRARQAPGPAAQQRPRHPPDLLLRLAFGQQAASLGQDLPGPQQGLYIVSDGMVSLAGHLLRGVEAAPATQAAQKRLDRAHARFLSSIKTLATVQKLVRPAVSPPDLLTRPAADTTTSG